LTILCAKGPQLHADKWLIDACSPADELLHW